MNPDGIHGVGRCSRWCPECQHFTRHEIGQRDEGVMQPAVCLGCDHEHDLPPRAGTIVVEAHPTRARGAYQLHDWRYRLGRWWRVCAPGARIHAARDVHPTTPTSKHPACPRCQARRVDKSPRTRESVATVNRTTNQGPRKRVPQAGAEGA